MENNNRNESNDITYVFKSDNHSIGCGNGNPGADMPDLNSSSLMNGGEYFYEITGDQALSLNDVGLTMENVGPLNIIISNCNSEQSQVVQNEECETTAQHVEGEYISDFDSSNLETRTEMVLSPEDQKDFIEMIERYNNTSYNAFSVENTGFVDANNCKIHIINNNDEKNHVRVLGDTNDSQNSNMIYYSENANIFTEVKKVQDTNDTTKIDIDTTNITKMESDSPAECAVFNVISSYDVDHSESKSGSQSVQNNIVIYSSDPNEENIFTSTLTGSNGEIIEVLDSDGFSSSSRFALLDEEGNIVGLLQSDPQLDETGGNTVASSYNISESAPEGTVLHVDNTIQRNAGSSYKKIKQSTKTGKEAKCAYKSQRRYQKQIKLPKNFEPQTKVKNCAEHEESWSTDFPSQTAPTPEIIVLHPLRTRKHTSYRNIEMNISPIANINEDKSFETQFDKISITVPLIAGVEQARRRKPKISQLKEDNYNINGEFQLDWIQSNKSYYERYSYDSDSAEIMEIFSRKKKVLANSNKDLEVKSNPSPLNTFSDVKTEPIQKRSEFTTETESSDEEPHYKAEVGKSLKCKKCSKIFKSNRSVTIHNKFCKANSLESQISVQSPKNDNYVLRESNCERPDSANKDVEKKPFDSPLLRKRKLATRSKNKPQAVKRKA